MSHRLSPYIAFFCLACSALLASCADPPTPITTSPVAATPSRPRPAVTVTVTSTPATPVIAVTPTVGVLYRLRAEFLGTTDVTFEVRLNGQQVGSFNADATSDVTPVIGLGTNRIEVQWKGQHEAEEHAKAQLFLESQRPGQDGWNSLFSREVARKTKEQQASASFDVVTPE